MDTKIKQYLEQLLVDAGQGDLPKEVREQLLLDLNQRLEQRLILAAVEGMPEAKQAEFQALAEKKPTAEQVQAFINEHVANPEAVFKKAFEEFRAIYLGA